MAKILAVLFTLAVLCLAPLFGTEVQAQILPPEMAQRIGAAAVRDPALMAQIQQMYRQRAGN